MNYSKNNDPIIEFKNVAKQFKNTRGIKDISLSIVNPNNIVGLIGNNGVGKTTLLKTLFREYAIQNGSIFIKGEPLSNKHLKKMAFFPDQNNFPKHFNIIEFAKFSAELKGIKYKVYKDKLEQLIDFLKLGELRKSKFANLSTGQQKRALLLSVLITKPEIIALDEPTANLDVESRIEFHNILRILAKELNICIIITSHIIDEMENLINKVVLIKEGKVVYDNNYSLEKDGKLEKLYNNYIVLNKVQKKNGESKKEQADSYASALVNIFKKNEEEK
ncbi:ABC transporter ATP-binding protein [Williamsoniiplasma lucivorax]|uniref:ABC transporter ATP-binding protein n=1 Tax=Williamsoniiplasma lucivorax TaxID=209274 RepID=A0A2S5RET6_9MOLU|nr:ABC transporter ATP-binding protein [Williamsoniiplasma lucivorax]PPE05833.1 ABC transporter ATP-binding protein [Williamsoniiplasma lucivorax]